MKEAMPNHDIGGVAGPAGRPLSPRLPPLLTTLVTGSLALPWQTLARDLSPTGGMPSCPGGGCGLQPSSTILLRPTGEWQFH